MENQRYPRTEKTQNNLKVKVFSSKNNFSFSESQSSDWDFFIKFESGKILIFNKLNELLIKNRIQNNKNLTPYLRLQLQNLFLKAQTNEKDQKFRGAIKKHHNSFQKKMGKKFSSIKSSFTYFEDSKLSKKIRALNTSTLNEVPRELQNIFRSYKHFILLVHEKGNRTARKYSYGENQHLNTENLQASEFDFIFNLIKKSKSRYFDSSSLTKFNPGVVGHFLARPLELKAHNFIILISKSSFLTPTDDNVNTFYKVSEILKPVIRSLIIREATQAKVFHNFLSIKLSPFPISIIDRDGIEVFNNRPHYIEGDEFRSTLLSTGDTIKIFTSNHDNNTETYHFERINLLGDLVNTLSHELSNPIFGMKLASNILSSEIEDSEAIEILNEIEKNLDRSQAILKNFSTIYNDSYQEVNLEEVIKETITLSKSETRSVDKKINNKLSSNFLIYTNPTWLNQIIFNLIINAFQAFPSKMLGRRPQIIFDISANESNIFIRLSDNGPGIPEENIDSIFEPFFTTKETGTGLGLIICKNLAKKLSGDLRLEDTSMNGTTFLLSLPIGENEHTSH